MPIPALSVLSAAMVLLAASPGLAQTQWPNQRAGDFVIKDFRFASGETIAELKLHYVTLGTEKRNAAGRDRQRRRAPARHQRLGRRLAAALARRRAVQARPAARCLEIFHRS